MKKIQLTPTDPNTEIVFTQYLEPKNKTYVAVNNFKTTKLSVYILMREPNGFIFRNVGNSYFGHSGTHLTPQDAITHALHVGETQVYEFDNLIQAVDFIHNQPVGRELYK